MASKLTFVTLGLLFIIVAQVCVRRVTSQWAEFDGTYYAFFYNDATWRTARQFCVDNGGALLFTDDVSAYQDKQGLLGFFARNTRHMPPGFNNRALFMWVDVECRTGDDDDPCELERSNVTGLPLDGRPVRFADLWGNGFPKAGLGGARVVWSFEESAFLRPPWQQVTLSELVSLLSWSLGVLRVCHYTQLHVHVCTCTGCDNSAYCFILTKQCHVVESHHRNTHVYRQFIHTCT